MRLRSVRVRNASRAAMGIGAALMVLALLLMWRDGRVESSSAQDWAYSRVIEDSSLSGAGDSQGPGNTSEQNAAALAALGGGGDPFAEGRGTSDGVLHDVVLTFTSDGAMYAGWQYRSKGGEGVQVANNNLVVSKKVEGPLPVGAMGVQVLGTATYATCSVTVDGVVVATQTARGTNHVAVCVG